MKKENYSNKKKIEQSVFKNMKKFIKNKGNKVSYKEMKEFLLNEYQEQLLPIDLDENLEISIDSEKGTLNAYIKEEPYPINMKVSIK